MINDVLKILLIEDNPSFSRALAAMIHCSSNALKEILVASSLEDGLEFLKQREVGLVFLDLSLPDSQGLDTIVALRRQSSTVPLIVMTGNDDEQVALDAIKLDAQDYLLKGDVVPRQLGRSMTYAMERKRLQTAESERLRLYRQREDFMAALTHDLKNPLIGANRILELLGEGHIGQVSDDARELVMAVRDGNNDLIKLIRDLADVYRYERDVSLLSWERVNLSRLILDYLGGIKPLLDRGLELESEVPHELHPVRADQVALRRVLQNLIGNAIKFSPDGGRVVIRAWQETDASLFAVTDEGPGISRAEQKNLFQRFCQGRYGRAFVGGTGLGLYLCRQIIEAHDGRIWCESDERNGSTFTVCLPAA